MADNEDALKRVSLHKRVDNDFAYHHPESIHVVDAHEMVRDICRRAAHDLIDHTPVGREQNLMLTALEEVMHWGNAGIAKEQYDPTK